MPATQEVETGTTVVQGPISPNKPGVMACTCYQDHVLRWPRQKTQNLIEKIKQTKRVVGVAQVIEHLPIKHLSSNTSTAKNQQKSFLKMNFQKKCSRRENTIYQHPAVDYSARFKEHQVSHWLEEW
jgi:hypothetical protein